MALDLSSGLVQTWIKSMSLVVVGDEDGQISEQKGDVQRKITEIRWWCVALSFYKG